MGRGRHSLGGFDCTRRRSVFASDECQDPCTSTIRVVVPFVARCVARPRRPFQAMLYDGDDAVSLARRLGEREAILDMLRPRYASR